MNKPILIICVMTLFFYQISEALAATTCSWAKDADGNDTTKLVVSGSGAFTDCGDDVKFSRWGKIATEIEILNGVTTIPAGAFSGAKKVTKLTIPNTLTVLPYCSFQGLSNVTSLTIPDSITYIGTGAFSGMSGVTGELVIPDSVTHIARSAFLGMSGVTGELVIPDSVITIGESAFNGMNSVMSLTIPDNVDTTNWNALAFKNFPTNANIVCLGVKEVCYAKLAKYFPEGDPECPENVTCNCSDSTICISSSRIQPATKEQCKGKYIWDDNSITKCRPMTASECNNSDKYFYSEGKCSNLPKIKTACKNAEFLWSDNSCVKSCPSGQVEYTNECMNEYPFAKKHYTPAEAAQWLNEDNNTITITFRK